MKKERDPLTGHQTTGHEWNGIKELNTRVPRIVWWFIGITHLYALIAWVLLPSWPWLNGNWDGLWQIDQKEQLQAAIAAGAIERVVWQQSMTDLALEEIAADPNLMGVVGVVGPRLYGDNCAACHGTFGTGGPGFPDLTDDAWLWGGDLQAIHETLRVGINTQHPEARFAQMPAFGDGILPPGDIRRVADYVQFLSGTPADPERLVAGQELFLANCAGCHGEEGRGNADIGAPNLADDAWIYGGSDAVLYETIRDGRMGFMPGWDERLSEVDRKILTLYVQLLGESPQARAQPTEERP